MKLKNMLNTNTFYIFYELIPKISKFWVGKPKSTYIRFRVNNSYSSAAYRYEIYTSIEDFFKKTLNVRQNFYTLIYKCRSNSFDEECIRISKFFEMHNMRIIFSNMKCAGLLFSNEKSKSYFKLKYPNFVDDKFIL